MRATALSAPRKKSSEPNWSRSPRLRQTKPASQNRLTKTKAAPTVAPRRRSATTFGNSPAARFSVRTRTRTPSCRAGGAYLTSPAEFVAANGALLRNAQYQEPSPETESTMENVVLAVDATGRTRRFAVTKVIITPNINTIAALLEQYKGIVIGVDGNDVGWENMTDPSYNGQADWGHALYVYDRAVRNGHNALKAKSSWCNEVKDHFINDEYFNAGGVFEALAITVKELPMPQIVSLNLQGTEGIFLEASTPEEYQALCLIFGKDPANPDKTV